MTDEINQDMFDKKTKSSPAEQDMLVYHLFNNIGEQNLISIELTMVADKDTMSLIDDLVDSHIPFDLHYNENGFMEIIYDKKD